MNRDVPLTFQTTPLPGLGLDEIVADVFSGERKHKQAAARAILAAVLLAGWQNQSVSYSRTRNWYAKSNRRPGLPFTYHNVVPVIDGLTAAGFTTNWIPPHSFLKRQSTARATPQLLDYAARNLASMDGPAFAWHVGELVKLRDANKRDLVLPNTAETRAMRRDVAEINEMLAGLNVILEGFPDQGGLVWMETTKGKPHPVYTHQNQLSRTFKYDLTQGGRFYGHWITQVLSHIRPAKNDSSPLRINGAECYERDYEEFHPRLLYSRLGLNSPLKKALLTEFHSTAKHNATKAVSPSSETMRTI